MDEDRFERLKSRLFMEGQEAVEDFLGYEIDPGEDKDTTDVRMDAVYLQMPDDELEKYYEKYGIAP